MKAGPTETRWLWPVLAIAAGLRLGLALQGGQAYFGDEARFMRGVLLYRSTLAGDWDLVRQALASPQHAGFTYVGALLCPFAHGLATLAGSGDWNQAVNVRLSFPFIAAVLGLVSVLNVWLVYRVALAWGGTAKEAVLAALLAALHASLAYQARHLLPYDAALTLFLLALLALARRTDGKGALGAGLLGGASFALYNGYWFVAPALAVVAMLRNPAAWKQKLVTGAWVGLGTGAAIALVMAPGTLAGGRDYWIEFLLFGGTAYQGLFTEGWSFPWEYYWRAESWLGLLLLGGCVGALLSQRARLPFRALLWLWLALALYVLLVIGSTVLHKFVVYGRSTRPLITVLCLLGGWAWYALLPRRRLAQASLVGAVLGLAAINLTPHFRISFPLDVQQAVWRDQGFPKLAVTYEGAMRVETWPVVNRPDLALVNPLILFPVRRHRPMPEGEILAVWRHPDSVPAYLYEGHVPRGRRLLLAHPPEMRLIRLSRPDEVPNLPPYEYWLTQEEVPRGY